MLKRNQTNHFETQLTGSLGHGQLIRVQQRRKLHHVSLQIVEIPGGKILLKTCAQKNKKSLYPIDLYNYAIENPPLNNCCWKACIAAAAAVGLRPPSAPS